MAFPREILVSGIAIAKKLTGGFQGQFTHEAWIGNDGLGRPQFDSPVQIDAIIDTTPKQIQRGATLIPVVAELTVVGDILPNGTVTDPPRQEPVDPQDRITCPDGTTGPIIDEPSGPLDPVTGRSYINIIRLGLFK